MLEEKSFSRVGGPQDIKVNVRVIAATNRNLEEQVKAERFREDLFYRLNVLPIVFRRCASIQRMCRRWLPSTSISSIANFARTSKALRSRR